MNPYPRTWIEIDLAALGHNLDHVRHLLPAGCRLALVAKADAYGHGLIPIARTAAHGHADWLCVATIQEGLAVREAGIDIPVLVISPILAIEAEQAVYYDLRVVVESLEVAAALSKAAAGQGKRAIIHLEVDTGLSRFGCNPEELCALADTIRALPSVELEGLCQHFVDSGLNPERTQAQAREFDELAQRVGPVKLTHACNSAGIFAAPRECRDMVRIGILAYGIDPNDLTQSRLAPVLAWNARVTALRTVPSGATVSYSETYACKRETVIATLGVGYGDGYPRALSNKGIVSIHGELAPVIGLVCMDQLLIDVTDVPKTKIGDVAQLIGPDVSVEKLAQLANTNCHEITTRIMGRVPRRYSGF
ncbi:MAG: alanine racemase [Chthonomonas sp.]|nr:alanine racemase [Chthonomonas sp.]